ncbi:MAG: hypothetical protein KGL35_18735, partial [Bradyrhizobium sp.]|nr:hypothetical protein [Bradyrhizobium sp.]
GFIRRRESSAPNNCRKESMPLFDCQLDHHPLVRIDAADPDAAKAEYFRRYAITGSTAAWNCNKAEPGSAAPVEPETWVNRRKELGTFVESTVTHNEPVKPASADKSMPFQPPKSEAAP